MGWGRFFFVCALVALAIVAVAVPILIPMSAVVAGGFFAVATACCSTAAFQVQAMASKQSTERKEGRKGQKRVKQQAQQSHMQQVRVSLQLQSLRRHDLQEGPCLTSSPLYALFPYLYLLVHRHP